MNVDMTNLPANRKAAAKELRVQAAGHQHRADEMRRQADELDGQPGPSGVDVAAIRARADAATEGPWGFGGKGIASMAQPQPNGPLIAMTDFTPRDIRDFPEGFDMLAEIRRSARNGEFIAHARSDVPALLDALAQKSAALDAANATIGRVEALHFIDPERPDPSHDTCAECCDDYPCPTRAALGVAGDDKDDGGET